MGVIQNIIDCFFRRNEEKEEQCNSFLKQVLNATRQTEQLFLDVENFIDPIEELKWKEQHSKLLSEIKTFHFNNIKKTKKYKTLIKEKDKLLNYEINFRNQVLNHNNNLAENKLDNAYDILDIVEGRKLDRQQMKCIVKDVQNHLVIAGAGTGKTTTVVGKIKYLLNTKKYRPDEILVLSFTNASASEMSERIEKETGIKLDALTFHKLGLNIIKRVNHLMPNISQLNLRKFIKEKLQVLMENEEYLKDLTEYLFYNAVMSKSEFEFFSLREYKDYLKLNPPTSYKKETLKSYGEMDIANYLYLNNVNYIYEHPYEVDTRTEEYAQYKPDFYLPDYNIYIEYFGIDREGNVPDYFKEDRMNDSKSYQMSMKWKRELHKGHGTKMIECYAYEKFDGELLEKLECKLKENNVELNPKTPSELWEDMSKEDSNPLEGLTELFGTIINLIKSNEYSIYDVRQLNLNNRYAKNNNTLLSLLEPIFNYYNDYLKERDEIDFNDMINLARKYIDEGKFVNPYKMVIVDEYQDISKARFNLLNSLRKSKNYQLFCVGDDWQSIYRFAGSDIGYIINFENYWGPSEISKIEKTYRFSSKLIEISSNFIMQNPNQIRKSIEGQNDYIYSVLGEIHAYKNENAMNHLSEKLDDLPSNASVFFIGRYTFDAKLLDDNPKFKYHYNNISGLVDVKYSNRPDLHIQFLTAHKSKGLQADYVFILNNRNTRMGFPSRIQDAPILDLLLEKCDDYPFSEERRLYYVALTRAKKKVFIVTLKDKESIFAKELKTNFESEIKREKYECPLCGGYLQKRTGKFGDFMGCSNYSYNGCKYTRKIKVKKPN